MPRMNQWGMSKLSLSEDTRTHAASNGKGEERVIGNPTQGRVRKLTVVTGLGESVLLEHAGNKLVPQPGAQARDAVDVVKRGLVQQEGLCAVNRVVCRGRPVGDMLQIRGWLRVSSLQRARGLTHR